MSLPDQYAEQHVMSVKCTIWLASLPTAYTASSTAVLMYCCTDVLLYLM